MAYQTLLYEKAGRIARLVLNRPQRLNAISADLPDELERAVAEANADGEVRVIVLKGAGRAFCAGFDLSPGLYTGPAEWDPSLDYAMTTRFAAKFMSLWYSRKPTIAQVHGWCVGGGTDMVLCSDIIIAAEDAQIGYAPARIWGAPFTAMWVYRLGPEWAKRHLLTGDPIDGKTAERIGLIYKAVAADRLEQEVENLAQRMANIPVSQLAAMKLLVNQAYENMGLRTTQLLGCILDGLMRHTPEGLAWRRLIDEKGIRAALDARDGPFGDYSAGKG
ncbi:MAG: crotonase/enoyl-CoA hydratase family protein [Dehalococcoidia bacterium]